MFRLLQEFVGGSKYFRDKLNEMVRALNPLINIRGDETFIRVEHGQGTGGLSIGLNINQVLARIPKQVPGAGGICVKITGHAAGGGKYDGTIMGGVANSASSGALTMPEGYTTGATCLIINTEEDAAGANWRLATGDYAIGIAGGTVGGAGAVPIVAIRGALGSLDSPLTLPVGSYSSPDGTTWDWTTDGVGFIATFMTGFGFDSSSGTVWWNTRDMHVDARGVIRSVTDETQGTLSTNPCPAP